MFKRSFIGYNPKSVDEHKENFEAQMNAQLEQIDTAVNSAFAEQNDLSEQLQNITNRIDASLMGTVLISKYQDDLAVVLNEFRAAADEKMAANQRETEEFSREITRQIAEIDEQIAAVKAKISLLSNGISIALDHPGNTLVELTEGTARIKDSIIRFTERVEETGVSMVSLKTKDGASQAVPAPSPNGVFSAGSTMNWSNVRQTMDGDSSKDGGVDQFLAKLRQAWQS